MVLDELHWIKHGSISEGDKKKKSILNARYTLVLKHFPQQLVLISRYIFKAHNFI